MSPVCSKKSVMGRISPTWVFWCQGQAPIQGSSAGIGVAGMSVPQGAAWSSAGCPKLVRTGMTVQLCHLLLLTLTSTLKKLWMLKCAELSTAAEAPGRVVGVPPQDLKK